MRLRSLHVIPAATLALLLGALGAGCARVEQTAGPLPGFEVTTLDGTLVSNESIKGRPALINFWSPQ